MALRAVVKIGEEILRQKSREVEVFDARLGQLIDDLFETMAKENGAGLAAVQVGVLKRVAVINTDGKKHELVNPVIVKSSGSATEYEGCLSIPGRQEAVSRPWRLTVRAYDRTGTPRLYEVEGYTARAFCHEMDHMDGVLFIDKALPKKEKRGARA